MSNSAFIAASFDASGSNFAAVYQALDHHRLRVVSTVKSGAQPAGREFVIERSTKIRSLVWATLSPSSRPQPLKKRKKGGDLEAPPHSGAGAASLDSVVLGTQQGTLLFYSPASGSIVHTLKTGSSAAVCSIVIPGKPGIPSAKLISLQVDGTVTEFDLTKMSLVASFVAPVEDCSTAATLSPHQFVVANTQPHLLADTEISISFPGFATPIRQLLPLGHSHFAALAAEDRQVTIYDAKSTKPLNYLTVPSTNAAHMSCSADASTLAVASEDGVVYVFENILKPQGSQQHQQHQQRKSKSVNRIAPKVTIEVVLEKKASQKLQVCQTRFADSFLQLVWPEQGSLPVFDQVKLTPQLQGTIKLEKQLAGPQAREFLVGGVDPASVGRYEDQKAAVASGTQLDYLSDNDDDEEETLADRLDALEVELNKQDKTSGGGRGPSASSRSPQSSNASSVSSSAAAAAGSASAASSSSASSSSGAAASSSSASSEQESRLRKKELKLKLSQPGSFSTLLNQSLTLNDKQLLEICLEEKDTDMIKTSIVKLEPALAAALLEHLAATMAHSQNRSAALTQWIRYVVVIHGGYLITLPNLLKTLAALHSTLSARAATLPRLLALQGRLELLEEQLAVRSEVAATVEDEDEDIPGAYYDEDEDAMIVNGEEAYDGADDDKSGDDDESDDDSEGAEAGNAFSDGNDDLYDDDEIMLE